MSKIGDHLKKFHTHAASHHDGLAECFGKLANFGKSQKSEMKDGDDVAECLGKIAAHHEAAAEFHRGMMEQCDKVTGDELGKNTGDLAKRLERLENAIVPTGISAVTPNAPGVRAVPRAGARPMPTEKPNVPIQFEKLTVIEE